MTIQALQRRLCVGSIIELLQRYLSWHTTRNTAKMFTFYTCDTGMIWSKKGITAEKIKINDYHDVRPDVTWSDRGNLMFTVGGWVIVFSMSSQWHPLKYAQIYSENQLYFIVHVASSILAYHSFKSPSWMGLSLHIRCLVSFPDLRLVFQTRILQILTH